MLPSVAHLRHSRGLPPAPPSSIVKSYTIKISKSKGVSFFLMNMFRPMCTSCNPLVETHSSKGFSVNNIFGQYVLNAHCWLKSPNTATQLVTECEILLEKLKKITKSQLPQKGYPLWTLLKFNNEISIWMQPRLKNPGFVQMVQHLLFCFFDQQNLHRNFLKAWPDQILAKVPISRQYFNQKAIEY